MPRAGLAVLGLIAVAASVLAGQRNDAPAAPAANDAVVKLNRGLEQHQVHLAFEPSTGYLRSVLKALDVPVESQTLVFSETSRQPEHITMANPRAIFFNDNTAVGWVNGNDSLEVAVQDPQQGILFYTLNQTPQAQPTFARRQDCHLCHFSATTLGVPGLVLESVLPMTDNPNEYVVGWPVDQRTLIPDRWGGWYVTGQAVPNPHLGNVPVYHAARPQVRAAVAPKLLSVTGQVKAGSYLTPYSDVVAQMVLNHQVTMMNLLSANRTAPDAAALVDYLLFIDEAPLTGAVEGNSGFAEKFAALGPRDRQGRSLRQLDLNRRLMRYPCSYMIYSEAFDALPAKAKAAVYDRMWQILSGKEHGEPYSRLSLADRQAVVEILRETKKDLPAYFVPVTR
jgi:hypothetical protein